MATTISVHYSRKQTDKLGDGSFDGIEIGGDLTLEVGDEENPFDLYNAGYAKLAESIEEKLATYTPRVIERPEYLAKGGAPPVATVVNNSQASPSAEPEKVTGRGWVEQQVKQNTAAIRDRIQQLPGEKIQPKGDGNNAIDEYGTPSTAVVVESEAVMYQKCRVFEVEVKAASNGNPFVSVRIGKRGEDGIPGQYTTARSFDALVIKQIAFKDEDGAYQYKVREGDFVDVWGFFKPWKNNAEKWDLELQKIQLHED